MMQAGRRADRKAADGAGIPLVCGPAYLLVQLGSHLDRSEGGKQGARWARWAVCGTLPPADERR